MSSRYKMCSLFACWYRYLQTNVCGIIKLGIVRRDEHYAVVITTA